MHHHAIHQPIMALSYLAYTSIASEGLTQDDVLAIFESSKRNNEQRNITGILVHGDNKFLQIIEGEKPVVEALYARLLNDARHGNVVKLAEGKLTKRFFPNWSMGLQAVDGTEFSAIVKLFGGERVTPHKGQLALTLVQGFVLTNIQFI